MNINKSLIFFDTEYTSWEGALERKWTGFGEAREIIQIGAVKVDQNFTIYEEFEILVKPFLNPRLSEYIKRLTKISQEDLNEYGVTLIEALNKFESFCEGRGKAIAISNGGDEKIFYENLRIYGATKIFRNLIFQDIQPYFKDYCTDEIHISIEEMSRRLSIAADHHSALNDSLTLVKIVKSLAIENIYDKFSRI